MLVIQIAWGTIVAGNRSLDFVFGKFKTIKPLKKLAWRDSLATQDVVFDFWSATCRCVRQGAVEPELMVAWWEMPRSPGHTFCDLLRAASVPTASFRRNPDRVR